MTAYNQPSLWHFKYGRECGTHISPVHTLLVLPHQGQPPMTRIYSDHHSPFIFSNSVGLRYYVNGTSDNTIIRVTFFAWSLCVFSWFCSHPTWEMICSNRIWKMICSNRLSTGPRLRCHPYCDRPQLHHTFHYGIIHHDVIFIQWWPIPSTMLGHIALKDYIIIKSSFNRSTVGFAPESTGNWTRSGCQD